MRSYQVFAAMPPERAEAFFGLLNEKMAPMFLQAVGAACSAFKSRPAYVLKQPFDKQASMVRRTLARVGGNTMADEVLAVYFLECRKELLTEWLDLLGIEHEDGALSDEDPSQPDPAELAKHVESYRAKEDDPDRELLLQAFAAQNSIEWPALDEIVTPS